MKTINGTVMNDTASQKASAAWGSVKRAATSDTSKRIAKGTLDIAICTTFLVGAWEVAKTAKAAIIG